MQGTVESGASEVPAPSQVTPATATPSGQTPTPQLAPTLQLTPAPQPTPTPLPTPTPPQAALSPQLAAPLFTLASAAPGEHVMTLRVTPEDLGPLTVRAHIDATGVRIELFAPGDAGREAVRHVLPELRRGLEDTGASLSLSTHNSPPDTGKDTGQGNSDAPRDTQQPARRDGNQGTNSTEDLPQRRRQLPPDVVLDPNSPHRLDILV
ncbi:flagellar hook-length control protein FliK [Paenarthrobacter nitroguajacolicus]|uniref:flagellar hook-length control protein FliK n=1 Tax=Paenarthrobacter nitroguajacolicus TaxID=211146 RepID=UPI002858F69C|nr:flagellar hook-length control protein FliK [Paenarthrobacter nitroguajacolicus]MDR6986195.1 flagellar hook-length control protein FliK [Paenarthrobacter nitroguajacolicus]